MPNTDKAAAAAVDKGADQGKATAKALTTSLGKFTSSLEPLKKAMKAAEKDASAKALQTLNDAIATAKSTLATASADVIKVENSLNVFGAALKGAGK